MLFIVGISYTSPASSSLIVATSPVIIALIGAALRLDRLTALAWVGIALSFAGIAVVVLGNEVGATPDALRASGGLPLLGDLLVFGATVVWAIYTTLAAPLLKRYSATTFTAMSLVVGTLPIVLIALPDLIRLDWRAVPVAGWGAALFSGLFALAIGYAIWNRGVQRLGGARTAVYSNLIPVVAALFAWIARGDRLTVYHLLGAAIVLAGINLTRMGRQARVEALPAEE